MFQAIWLKINYQTRYTVRLDTPLLIAKCVQSLQDFFQILRVQAPKVRASKEKILMTSQGVIGQHNSVHEQAAQYSRHSVPDVYAY